MFSVKKISLFFKTSVCLITFAKQFLRSAFMKKKNIISHWKVTGIKVKGEKNWILIREKQWASKIMSYNNYKKMIFQQTINWLTDLISHNLLCKLVYWLCYLIKASHTHCYLVVSWVKDVYRDFGLAGYFGELAGYFGELAGYSILAPMDRTLESKWTDPVDHLLKSASRNRI